MFFAAPMMYAPPMMCSPHAHYRRPSCGPCGASPLLFVLALLFLPSLLRVAFVALHIFFHVAVHFAFAALVMKLLSGAFCDGDEMRSESCPTTKSCFAKMKAAAQKAKACDPCACDPCDSKSTVREELAKKATKTRVDLSSGRVETTADGFRLVLAAPGVKPDDLAVTFVDQTLHIKGETARGDSVYCIETQWTAPSSVDLSTATVTHADGALTITLQKKAAKRIPVTAEAAVKVVAAEPVETEEPAAEAKTSSGESSEGEWEPLESTPLEEKKKC